MQLLAHFVLLSRRLLYEAFVEMGSDERNCGPVNAAKRMSRLVLLIFFFIRLLSLILALDVVREVVTNIPKG